MPTKTNAKNKPAAPKQTKWNGYRWEQENDLLRIDAKTIDAMGSREKKAFTYALFHQTQMLTSMHAYAASGGGKMLESMLCLARMNSMGTVAKGPVERFIIELINRHYVSGLSMNEVQQMVSDLSSDFEALAKTARTISERYQSLQPNTGGAE